ncbi:hypothetical protein, partial [Thermogutta sp.]|uniref:hypothetical protein n=1 Tax=Thermogutta sp. TaxID=1962930 RepID=UPI00322043CB
MLNAPVEVQIGGDTADQPIKIPLGDEDWQVFKLSSGRDQGRKVKQVSLGSYLVIVPETWQRDEEKAGTAPTTPEPVFLDGYLAHFFELSEATPFCIAFHDDQGNPIIIESGGPQFCLVGQEIRDDSEGIGPLFGGL